MLIGLGHEFIRNGVITVTTCDIDRKAKKGKNTGSCRPNQSLVCKPDLTLEEEKKGSLRVPWRGTSF